MDKLADSRFYSLIPPNLKNPISKALSFALDNQTFKLTEYIKYTLILADVANLSEALCDAVASSFGIEGYDITLDLSVKRRLIQSMFLVSYSRGTTQSLNKAVGTFYGGAEAVEFFDYNTDPFHFKVVVDLIDSGVTNEQHREMTRRIELYKNLRSHLDTVDYRVGADGGVNIGINSRYGTVLTVHPYKPDAIESFSTANIGGNVR